MMLMVYALKKKSVCKSGAFLGIVVAFVLSIANHAFFVCLVVFFFSSSKATKFRGHIKHKFEKDFKDGEGQRNWIQVFCNCGVATLLAVLYLIDCGSGEKPINFTSFYRSSWLGLGVMSRFFALLHRFVNICSAGSFASCNGDTWASELGTVFGSSDPFLITNLRRVPKGTNGGISIIGLIVSFLGGLLVGLGYFLTIIYTDDTSNYFNPPQWPTILIGGFAGLFGSLLDSLLGASFQYSGLDSEGKIADRPGKYIRHISGLSILDNHSVNLISSFLTAVIIPIISVKVWPDV